MKTVLFILLLYMQAPVGPSHHVKDNAAVTGQGFFWDAVNDYVKKREAKQRLRVVKKLEAPGCKDAVLKTDVDQSNRYYIDIFIKPGKRSRTIEVLNGGEKIKT